MGPDSDRCGHRELMKTQVMCGAQAFGGRFGRAFARIAVTFECHLRVEHHAKHLTYVSPVSPHEISVREVLLTENEPHFLDEEPEVQRGCSWSRHIHIASKC